MKTWLRMLSLLPLLACCSQGAVDPKGVYVLTTEKSSYRLTIADHGKFGLEGSHGRAPIEGTWTTEGEGDKEELHQYDVLNQSRKIVAKRRKNRV